MANRPARWDLLGYDADPITSRPDEIEELAKYYRDMAEDIERAAAQLRPVGEGDLSTGEGESVDKIRTRSRDVSNSLVQMHGRYQAAGDAIGRFRDAVGSEADRSGGGTVMATSWAAVQRATEVDGELGSVQRTADPLQAARDAGTEPTAEQQDDARRRSDRIDDLTGQLNAARSLLAQAQSDLAQAGQAAAAAMKGSWNDGLHDSGWYKFLHALIKIFTVIGMILGVLAFFIPGLGLAAIVGAISAGFALVAAALKFSTGEGSIFELVMSLVGIASLGLGSKITALTKGAISKGITTGRTSIKSSTQAALRAGQDRRTDIAKLWLRGKFDVAKGEQLHDLIAPFNQWTKQQLGPKLTAFDEQFAKPGPSWWNLGSVGRIARDDVGLLGKQFGNPSTWAEAVTKGGSRFVPSSRADGAFVHVSEKTDSLFWQRFFGVDGIVKRNELDSWLTTRGLEGIGSIGKTNWQYLGSVAGSLWGKGTFIGQNIAFGSDFGDPRPWSAWTSAHKGALPDVHADYSTAQPVRPAQTGA
ncbi:DUF308 domain-containing protein [Curtobacterium sp. TXMA1]|uniref:DUF308 domain-containing protein n=1 Tax=Curtobacterium sp. TXMA1 TaxID=2876939 RepID=UPI001CCBFA19|nr:DUF308 domain-containing protein [Curtobacterium sp. TXMA1]UBQ02577.1 hypothetical protein LCG91_16265 [Curtobacterium sp. TXMA1]